ncbi:MarR family transcriptional regulator [Asticcacaulis sp. SL142]|uniref:MarR family winged helix-turn-helix transcriptional regulator n=1 Tax=Asticcacaulis sp. SL142 TaxID=2995155 RepID=UPI00226D3018|nr:MarR family transcriptional regulator [Asticcacaulis sp. SL142]WAC49238.1 MarR family transcriptional regulator [Asticcacaulis sp. SL142]
MRQGLPEYSAYLPHNIEQLSEMVSAIAAAAHDAHGLTATEWRILAMLSAHGRVPQKAIAAGVGVEKVVAWRAITSLRKKRFVSRQFCEGDYRAYDLFLTEAGRHKFEDTVPVARDREAVLIAGLTRDEVRRLCELLKKLAPAEAADDDAEAFSAHLPTDFKQASAA